MKEKPLVILAANWSPTNRYVKKVWLNETALEHWWIKHSEIEGGGLLRFEMSPEPALR